MPADFLPGNFGHFFQEVILRFVALEEFQGHFEIRFHPHFVAGFEFDAQQFLAAINDASLNALRIGGNADAPVVHDFADFGDWPVFGWPHIADNRVTFVDLDARADVEFGFVNVGVNLHHELLVADGDESQLVGFFGLNFAFDALFGRLAQINADAIGGLGEFVISLFVLLDDFRGFFQLFFVGVELMAQQQQSVVGARVFDAARIEDFV